MYLTGSALALGNWELKEAVRLSYFGDAYWQVDCTIRRDEFPIRYPFNTDNYILYCELCLKW